MAANAFGKEELLGNPPGLYPVCLIFWLDLGG